MDDLLETSVQVVAVIVVAAVFALCLGLLQAIAKVTP